MGEEQSGKEGINKPSLDKKYVWGIVAIGVFLVMVAVASYYFLQRGTLSGPSIQEQAVPHGSISLEDLGGLQDYAEYKTVFYGNIEKIESGRIELRNGRVKTFDAETTKFVAYSGIPPSVTILDENLAIEAISSGEFVYGKQVGDDLAIFVRKARK